MSSKQKKFFIALLLLCAYVSAMCLGYSIYVTEQIEAFKENIVELVEKASAEGK